MSFTLLHQHLSCGGAPSAAMCRMCRDRGQVAWRASLVRAFGESDTAFPCPVHKPWHGVAPPPPRIAAAGPVRTRILVLAISSDDGRGDARRRRCNATWAGPDYARHVKPDAVTIRFVVGGGRGPAYADGDTVTVPTPDGYNDLPAKVRAALAYALDNYDFDYIFKCDDDSYVQIIRLALADWSGDNYVGRGWEYAGVRVAYGGAGYLLSHAAARAVVAGMNVNTGLEDGEIGRALAARGFPLRDDPRLYGHADPAWWPCGCNTMITCHHVESDDAMRAIHRLATGAARWPDHPVLTHRGDIGDIIYAMPAARAFAAVNRGGGGPAVLRLMPAAFTRQRMTAAIAGNIRPLLEAQDYIERVEFAEAPGDLALDAWRGLPYPPHKLNLSDIQLRPFGLPYASHSQHAWLSVTPNPVAPTVIHRSGRYRNANFPWPAYLRRHPDAIFVGAPDEHADFVRQFGPIPFYPTADLLALARVIAGSKLFIGNQSAPAAIAEGLKHRKILEVCPSMDNCEFVRPGAIYVRDARNIENAAVDGR